MGAVGACRSLSKLSWRSYVASCRGSVQSHVTSVVEVLVMVVVVIIVGEMEVVIAVAEAVVAVVAVAPVALVTGACSSSSTSSSKKKQPAATTAAALEHVNLLNRISLDTLTSAKIPFQCWLARNDVQHHQTLAKKFSKQRLLNKNN